MKTVIGKHDYYSVWMFGFDAFWFRWHGAGKPGMWTAHVATLGNIGKNVDCVVDDFGNLVGVTE